MIHPDYRSAELPNLPCFRLLWVRAWTWFRRLVHSEFSNTLRIWAVGATRGAPAFVSTSINFSFFSVPLEPSIDDVVDIGGHGVLCKLRVRELSFAAVFTTRPGTGAGHVCGDTGIGTGGTTENRGWELEDGAEQRGSMYFACAFGARGLTWRLRDGKRSHAEAVYDGASRYPCQRGTTS